MRGLKKLMLIVLATAIAIFAGACRTNTKVTVVDSQADWVKLGPDVRGHVYLWNHKAGHWELQTAPMQLPQGWVAGPEPH